MKNEVTKNSVCQIKFELLQFNHKDFIYNHSLFMTKDYVVIHLGPMRASPLSFISQPVAEVIKYDENAECKFLIYNKNTQETKFVDAPSFIFLHSINSYEVDDTLHLDFVEYEEKETPYSRLYLKNFYDNDCAFDTQASRVKINLIDYSIETETLNKNNVEFPRINEEYSSKKYKYAYFGSRTDDELFLNSIVKLNTQSNDTIIKHFPGCLISEPIFTAQPNASNEDEGVIFLNAIDLQRQLSFIAYLNAKDLSVLYKAYLPIQIPPALHGITLKK